MFLTIQQFCEYFSTDPWRTLWSPGDLFGALGTSLPPRGFRSRSFVTLRLGTDLDDLEGEDEDGAWGDVGAHLPVAVRNLARDHELPFVAFLHHLHRFGPAGDDLVGRELDGLAALVGRVELLSVDRGAAVVAGARGGGGRGRATGGAVHQDAVLETGRELHDAILELVGLEVRDTLGGGGGVRGAGEGEEREEREDVVETGHDDHSRARDQWRRTAIGIPRVNDVSRHLFCRTIFSHFIQMTNCPMLIFPSTTFSVTKDENTPIPKCNKCSLQPYLFLPPLPPGPARSFSQSAFAFSATANAPTIPASTPFFELTVNKKHRQASYPYRRLK